MAISAGPTGTYQERILLQGSAAVRRPRRSGPSRHEARLAYALLTPTLLVILFLVAYPFFASIVLSLQDKMVGAPGRFVGLDNYEALFRDEIFLRTAWNSVVYTVAAVALKFVLGLTMALVLDQERRFNNFFRTLLFVPWAVPVVIASLNWRWIYDDLSGFLNNFLITMHITSDIISWLADPRLAMGCVVAVVVWAGTRLGLLESAKVDYPKTWDEFIETSKKIQSPPRLYAFGMCLGLVEDTTDNVMNLLWCYGGKMVEADNKTVVMTRPRTSPG